MSESTWLVEFDGGHWHVYNENGGWAGGGHGAGTPPGAGPMGESAGLGEFGGGHWHVYNENGGWSVTGHGLGTPLVAVHVAKLMTAYQQDSRVIDNGDGPFTLLAPSGGRRRI